MRRRIDPKIYHFGEEATEMINDYMVGFSTKVSINQMAGRFTINLNPSKIKNIPRLSRKMIPRMMQLIKPMDLLVFKFTSDEPYFMGIVDNVQFDQQLSNHGNYDPGITINGRDGGKLLQLSPFALPPLVISKIQQTAKRFKEIYPEFDINEKNIAYINQMYSNSGAILSDVLNKDYYTAIENLFKRANIISFPLNNITNRGNWGDYFHLSKDYIKSYPGERTLSAAAAKSNNMAQALQTLADPAVYDTWIDTKIINGKPYWVFRYRPKPYDRLDDYLPAVFLKDTESDDWKAFTNKAVEMGMEKLEDLAAKNDFYSAIADVSYDRMQTFIGDYKYWNLKNWKNMKAGYSDQQITSCFSTSILSPFAGTSGMTHAFINHAKMAKYGIRYKNIETKTHYIKSEDYEDKIKALQGDNAKRTEYFKRKQMHQLLNSMRQMNWAKLDNLMYLGQVTTFADDRIRAGDKIRIPDMITPFGTGITAIATSVGNKYARTPQSSQLSTVIEFARGENEGMRESYENNPFIDQVWQSFIGQQWYEANKKRLQFTGGIVE